MDGVPLFLFMSHRGDQQRLPPTNRTMVDELVQSGSLRSQECIDAFHAVDRQHFWPSDHGELAYADMPLRSGRLHLSAPHIYAKALESLLPLNAGMSFLNVGSGTGYFNSIVSELTGGLATNHGIDIWSETVAHAAQRCQQLGKKNIEFTLGNAYQLNINQTARYDRIYLGACANSRSKYLYRLLEVGGILIGPFQVGHSQQLRRVVRQSETLFQVDVLGSVQFAPLIEPTPTPVRRPSTSCGDSSTAPPGSGSVAESAAATPRSPPDESTQPLGLPGVPFTFALSERPWTPERCFLYPASYRRAVAVGLFCKQRDIHLPCLPTEIWIKHIFPWCPRYWFELSRPPSAHAATATPCKRLCTGRDVDETESDDADADAASTRAPSSAGPSVQGTPQPGPSEPSADIEVDDEDIPGAIEVEDTCFEVFGNGQRHAIGRDRDPDDMEPDDGHRLVPLHVLQLLEEDARRRRRRWELRQEVEEQQEDDDDEEQEEGEAAEDDNTMQDVVETGTDVEDENDYEDEDEDEDEDEEMV